MRHCYSGMLLKAAEAVPLQHSNSRFRSRENQEVGKWKSKSANRRRISMEHAGRSASEGEKGSQREPSGSGTQMSRRGKSETEKSESGSR
jgi:hypothetical protein